LWGDISNCYSYSRQRVWYLTNRYCCANYAVVFTINHFYMKKIIGFLALSGIVLIMSCGDRKTEVKKEVVVVPPKATVEVKKPTTVVLDKNGVKVESKKVDVTVKKQ